MSINIGQNQIGKIYLGSEEIGFGFLGSTQVYGNPPPVWEGLKFTATQDNSRVSLQGGSSTVQDIQYSKDEGLSWTSWSVGSAITLNNGETLCIKNNTNTLNTGITGYIYFSMYSGRILASGDISSMINYAPLSNYCFYGLFSSCSEYLTSAPELPATTLASYCYAKMFMSCSSLTTAPKLPATTLASHCYEQMFSRCSSLVSAPELPATTLADNCYYGMFSRCTSLSNIKLHYTGNFSSSYFRNWVSGVSSTGTFYYNGSDTTTGPSAIPTGWTVQAFGPAYDINKVSIDNTQGFVYDDFPTQCKSMTINYSSVAVTQPGTMGYCIKGITSAGAEVVLGQADIATGTYTITIDTANKDLTKVVFAPYGIPLQSKWKDITLNKPDGKLYFKGTWITSDNIYELYFNTIQFNYA